MKKLLLAGLLLTGLYVSVSSINAGCHGCGCSKSAKTEKVVKAKKNSKNGNGVQQSRWDQFTAWLRGIKEDVSEAFQSPCSENGKQK